MRKSKQRDLVNDKIPGLIIHMGIPAAVGYLFNTAYNVVDTYWGGTISTNTLAALSLSFPVFLITLAIGFGISSGTSALIANSLGAKKKERAVQLQAQAISFALVSTAIYTVPIIFLLKPIFRFMSGDEALVQTAFNYAAVLVGGSVFFIINTVFNAGLTARGDTKTYRNTLIFGAIVNIGLDPLFIYGLRIGGVQVIPAMGEAGIAIATILIQAVESIYIFYRLKKAGGLGEKPSLRDLKPSYTCWKEIGGQGIPSAVNLATISLGTFVITYFIAVYGAEAIAAYGSAIRIEQIALVPTIGLNIALATLVGQNNGAGRLDRVRKSFYVSLQMGIAVMIIMLTPVLLFANSLLRLFTDNAMVLRIGIRYLYIQALTFYSYIVMNQANSIMQGLKRPGMILWIGLYRQIAAPWLVFAGFAAFTTLGVDGVWWGLVIVNWSAAIFSLVWARHILCKAEKAQADTADAPSPPMTENTSSS